MTKKKKLISFIIIGIAIIVALVVVIANRPEPIPTNEWVSENGINCYYDSEGNTVTGWVQIAPEESSPNVEEWCYFDEEGKFIEDYDKSYEGETTIFVDISKQMLSYFEDGEIKLHCHIISGTKGTSDTPTGEFEILHMNKDTRIVGATWDYDHVVWMAFIGQEYGLHSAWWQDDALFDDPTSYYENGSHGCVNMREKDAITLYEMIDIGTPVIIQE